MTESENRQITERMMISGNLSPATFLPWIDRHAAKLGLSRTISYSSEKRIEIELMGPHELIDMMEMGCALGPFEVWVDTIERHVLT
ncbi:acylphosphatase [Agrobacterium tumefaciens]|uniref:Acylphosphatase n=1 Tax=Agrobacterium tumefaciens TaxID=358 RepID=A0A4D7Z755_AGRTU|nr:acylphosphatase [Agrobacterium tumefaciens]QCL97870.1 acylphosphatase [Agrobacterium tumefaciens]